MSQFFYNQLLTVAKVAEIFGVSESTIRNLIRKGELDTVRIGTNPKGKGVRVPRSSVDKFVGDQLSKTRQIRLIRKKEKGEE